MRKTPLTLAILAGLVIGASARIIDYQMNDLAGKKTSEIVNDGTDLGSISGDAQGVSTDGAGNLHYAGVNVNSTRKQVLASTYSSGILQLEYRVAAWDYMGNDVSDRIAFSLWNSASSTGLKAMIDYNASGTRIRVSGATAGKQKIINQFSGTDLLIKATANLDANTFSAEYNLGGAGWTTIATDEVLGISSIDEFRLVTDGTPIWGDSNSIDVDYVTVEVVPEPATVGLLGAAAMGLYMIRRKRRTRAESIILKFERR